MTEEATKPRLGPTQPTMTEALAERLDEAASAAVVGGCVERDNVDVSDEPAERVDGGWWVTVRIFISDGSF